VELVVQWMPKDPATSQRNDLLPSPARGEHLQEIDGPVNPSVGQPAPLFLEVVPGDELLGTDRISRDALRYNSCVS